MATERLRVILEMAASQYNREARQAATATGSIGTAAKGAATQTGVLERKMPQLGSTLRGAAVTGAIISVGRGLWNTVEAAERINSIASITEQVIRETGGAANVTAGQVQAMGDRLEALTGTQSEVVQEGANVLLTFKNIRNEVGDGNDVFDRTVGLMLDVGAVMGTDASSGAIQLGKALNDPVANMGALSRAGLTFSQTQKDQIKDLVEGNNLLAAQKIILGELESQLGGTAEASIDSSDKIANSVGIITDAVGLALLPAIDALGTEIAAMVGMTDDLDRVAAHAGGAAESAEALLTVIAEETGGAGFLNGVATAIEGVAFGLVPGISRMERFRDTLEGIVPRLTVTELQRARDGIDQLGEEMGLTQSEIDLVAEVLDNRLGRAAAESADQVHILRGEVDDAGGAAHGAAGDFEGLGQAAEDLGTDLEYPARTGQDLADALAAVNSAMLEAANPVFAAQQALARYEEALEAANEDGEVTNEELLNIAEAALEANAKLSELGAGNVAGGIQAIADALGISFGAAQDLIEELGIIDGTEVEVAFKVDVDDWSLPQITIPRQQLPTPRGGSSITVDPGNFRHAGGPGRPGEPYVIRPDEEIFVPDGNGQFLLNDQVLAALKGLSGGSTTRNVTNNFNVERSGEPTADAQLVGAIHSVVRRMEQK